MQVTHFNNTVFATFYKYYWEGGQGHIWYFRLWSDNCGEQFKNNFHFGWGLLSYNNTTWMPFSSTSLHQNMEKVFVIVRGHQQACLCLGCLTPDCASDCLGVVCLLKHLWDKFCLENSLRLAQPRGEKISQLPQG